MTENIENNDNIVSGILEIIDRGHGFLRTVQYNFASRPTDPFVSRDLIKKYGLRNGLFVEASSSGKRGQNPTIIDVLKLNGHPPDDYFDQKNFDDFTVIDPHEHIRLETGPEPLGTRIIDLLTPIGKGQRGLIVAPPRTGKTILLQQIAHGITTNHPEIDLVMLLIDERPEEVTDMKRKIKGDVLASNNDKPADSHVHLAQLALEFVKRKVEFGKDVVVLLDSITRLGRAFNAWGKSSGRTMSGGMDIRAMTLPKQMFGSARKCEEGGSLTIMATALIDTGSRMDEVIFQEFKGTGNMELVLDRDLANKRIYPAINIQQSGTRKEELLIGKESLDKLFRLRRHLDSLQSGQDVQALIKVVTKHPSNKELLAALP